MVRNCGVVHCFNNTKKTPAMRFFAIPRIVKHQGERDMEISGRRRMAWIAALNRKKEDLTELKMLHTKVCEEHFVKGIQLQIIVAQYSHQFNSFVLFKASQLIFAMKPM
jgi:THAP domain